MTEEKKKKKEKKNKNVNPYLLLFLVIVACGLLSYIISPGAFVRETVNGRTVIDPSSYHVVERTPVSFLDFFKAVPEGLIGAGNVVFLILIVGGSIEVLNRSGALGMGINKLIEKFGDKGNAMIVIIMIFFSILGGF